MQQWLYWQQHTPSFTKGQAVQQSHILTYNEKHLDLLLIAVLMSRLSNLRCIQTVPSKPLQTQVSKTTVSQFFGN